MPRIKRTCPTIIYWLFDIRPETIAAGWQSGRPFYCGKTVGAPGQRLLAHKSHARRRPDREHSKRLLEYGEHVAIRVIETVPPDGCWITRERHWIAHLRSHFPGATNIADGGEDGAGRTPLGLTNLVTRFPVDLIERLGRIKRMTGIPNSEIIRRGVEEEVEKREKDLKKSKD